MPDTPPPLPLHGVRVLDIGTLIAGPFGPTLLGDFGADVIKVEQPGIGDPIRGSSAGQQEGGVGLHWLLHARNKRSVTLNLRELEGQALLRRLIAVSDVLVENFTPGTLDEWGFSWEAVHALNPRLIMVRVSGFGQTGPYSRRPGYDRIALGFSGYLYTTGYPDRPPVRPSIATADYTTAVFNALATLLALYWRDAQGGEGQLIDLALFEPLFRISEDIVPAFAKFGVVRERTGNRNPNFSPADTFETGDGRFIMIAAGGDGVFRRLATVMGRDDLPADPRYARARDRAVNADALCAEVAAWVAERTYDEVFETLEAAGVPAGGVYSVADIMDDPHYAAREEIVAVEHPVAGTVKMPAVLPKLSASPGTIRSPGPGLGEHNEEVYGDLLGMSEDEQAALVARGII